MILSITDHALRRFAEYNKSFTVFVPKHHQICLDLTMAKRTRSSVLTFLGAFLNALKVVPPRNHVMWKFLKYGVTDNRFYRLNNGQCFVIVHEPNADTIVTVAQTDVKKSGAWEIDMNVASPYGAMYLKDVDSVSVPYRLKIGVSYVTLVKILRHVNVPFKFGVSTSKVAL